MKRVYLHIGHPKTATSLMQTYLFNKHSQINNLGKPGKKNLDYIRLLMTEYNEEAFERKVNKSNLIPSEFIFSEIKPNMISDEGFLTPFPRNLDNLLHLTKMARVFNQIEDRNCALRVIITIRKQSELILSQYSKGINHFIKVNDEWKNFNNLIKFYSSNKKAEHKQLGFYESFKHYRTYKHLVSLFGEKNIKVLVYEKFDQKPEDFITELSEFLGVDDKESINLIQGIRDNVTPRTNNKEYIVKNPYYFGQESSLVSGILGQILKPLDLIKNFHHKTLTLKKKIGSLSLKQRLNRFNQRKMDQYVSLSKEELRNIKDYYGNDNMKIDEKLSLNLEKYGYF